MLQVRTEGHGQSTGTAMTIGRPEGRQRAEGSTGPGSCPEGRQPSDWGLRPGAGPAHTERRGSKSQKLNAVKVEALCSRPGPKSAG